MRSNKDLDEDVVQKQGDEFKMYSGDGTDKTWWQRTHLRVQKREK